MDLETFRERDPERDIIELMRNELFPSLNATFECEETFTNGECLMDRQCLFASAPDLNGEPTF